MSTPPRHGSSARLGEASTYWALSRPSGRNRKNTTWSSRTSEPSAVTVRPEMMPTEAESSRM